jgi:hypothetical protein
MAWVRSAYTVVVVKPEDVDANRRIILKRVLEKRDGGGGFNWLRIERPVAGSCEHGNESSGSIKCWEFLVWLSDCGLLKDSAPWSLLNRIKLFFYLNKR